MESMEPSLKIENVYPNWKGDAIKAVTEAIGNGITKETAERFIEKILQAPN